MDLIFTENIKYFIWKYDNYGGVNMEEEPLYKNLISSMDIDRGINNIDHFYFSKENLFKIQEFKDDIEQSNDAIELNLIRTFAYKEGIILILKKVRKNNDAWNNLLIGDQKTFSGSKLFYLNQDFSKILVLSVKENMEGKLMMVINRMNKINEKISRYNLKIKKENIDVYNKRLKNKDKKDRYINLINKNLRV